MINIEDMVKVEITRTTELKGYAVQKAANGKWYNYPAILCEDSVVYLQNSVTGEWYPADVGYFFPNREYENEQACFLASYEHCVKENNVE